MSFAQSSGAPRVSELPSVDPIWDAVRGEAKVAADTEPALGGFIFSTVLASETLERAIIHRVAQRLHHHDLSAGAIEHTRSGTCLRMRRNSAARSGPIWRPSMTAIPPVSAIWSRCFISKGSMRS